MDTENLLRAFFNACENERRPLDEQLERNLRERLGLERSAQGPTRAAREQLVEAEREGY